MWWFPLAFTTAVTESLKDLLIKQRPHVLNPWLVAWGLVAVSALLLAPIVAIQGAPPIGPDFWWSVTASAAINSLAFFLYIRALGGSDLSLTTPMLAFTPLFLLITSPIMVDEFPSALGLTGIALIVGGSYVLNLRARADGPLAPFKAIIKAPGPRLMLLVAAIWSISGNLDKIATVNASPLFYVTLVFALMAVMMGPVALWLGRAQAQDLPSAWRFLLLLGALNAFGVFCQMVAVEHTLVPYVIAVKRFNAVLGVVWGGLFLKEENIGSRLIGAAIMVGGVLLIALT